MFPNSLYYKLKPLIPRRVQIELRRRIVLRKKGQYSHVWPIDESAGKQPEGWTGWPDGKKFALVLTHDVETAEGQGKCLKLMELEKSLGFRSCFNFIAEEYRVFPELRLYLEQQGFEVGLHGLCHSQNLFRSRSEFERKAVRINQWLKDWGCAGFRSPSMYHNLDWIRDLNIQYDSSTFDTDPFEPQPDGVGTIFPFWVSSRQTADVLTPLPKSPPTSNLRPPTPLAKGYVELPYTLPQDFTLFIIMGEKDIGIWKKKLDWIAQKGGMALLITHPDYMNFAERDSKKEGYPLKHYRKLLEYIQTNYSGSYWNVLPKDITRLWEAPQLNKDSKPSISIHQPSKKIWIDLDNSPHVPFFHPIINELRNRGHEIILTTRDCSQTCGLADLYSMRYKRVGRHYGKNKALKVAGTVFRAIQLSGVLRNQKPDIAISHGSRAQMLSARMLKVPSLVIEDYEHVKGFIFPTWIMVPEIIPDSSIKYRRARLLRYQGIKEDVYVPTFEPDPVIRATLGIGEDHLMVTIRPPATEAHYHNAQSEALFAEAVNYLGKQENTRLVILPRYDGQNVTIRDEWPEWCRSGKITIPEQVVDGLSLIWASDFVISGGGTMNREAAALGVPVYSIFRGKIGAVDRYLSEKGKLILLETTADLPRKVKLIKRNRELSLNRSNATLNVVVNNILKVLGN